ncbi:MAG: 30S ribosomal protein S9 [Candidatus Fermentibacteraceae bacterium]|jgi:small subunit ribosomal protein S9
MDQHIGVGRRKTSTARCYLRPGSGRVVINDRTPLEYFGDLSQKDHALEPLHAVRVMGIFDVVVNVRGGGITGQAGAIRMGIARALVDANPEYRQTLKTQGMLRRDPRIVERKKYGRPKARKRFQFSKR